MKTMKILSQLRIRKTIWAKQLPFLILGTCVFVLSISSERISYAEDTPPNTDNLASLSWDNFKESCLHPEKFHSQAPPANIRVQCLDVRREYLSAVPGSVSLPAARSVSFAVFSSKYKVNAETAYQAAESRNGSCTNFKEVEKTLAVERKLSCDEILGIKTSLKDFCETTLDITKKTHPKLIQQRETGKTLSTCKNGNL